MSFDSKKIEFSREHINVAQFDLDKCNLVHGTAPCTATETGDDKCFNCFETCNDLPNYDNTVSTGAQTISVVASAGTFTRSAGSYITDGFAVGEKAFMLGHAEAGNNATFIISVLTATVLTVVDKYGLVDETGGGDESVNKKVFKTFSMCERDSPLPLGFNVGAGNPDVIPSMMSIDISAAEIDVKGGFGVRSNVTLTFKDSPHSDIDIDPYLSDRTYAALDMATFWTKLRARNPNYQFRNLRVLSGYLSAGVYDIANFQTRSYVIEKMNVSNGICNIIGKDPLKLASGKKAQAPVPSVGLTTGAMTNVQTTVTVVTGAGVEYDASGWILIDSELMSFTRSGDVFTIVRGQKNTVAAAHSSGVTVQQCLNYTGQSLDFIVRDLLTNFASVDPSFISSTAWDSEVSTYSSGNLEGILVKPMDVNKILIELTEAIPHYLWWDERSQLIELTILKAPPSSAGTLGMDNSLIKKSVRLIDDPESRVSTVFVNFGMYDPTKKLDEISNYQQSWVRIDTDSIAKYGSSEVKAINSRWLNNNNKAGAQKVATLIGRRFADVQRKITFKLDAKDSDGATGLWAGQTRNINHRDMVNFIGEPIDTMFQIISAKEDKDYQFKGLEFKYGQELADDIASTDEIVYYSAGSLNPYQNVNLYDDFVAIYGVPTATTEAIFIVDSGSIVGSSSTATDSMDTGSSWPVFTTGFIKIIVGSGCFIVGAGGNGANGDNTPAATNAGDAINMQTDITIENSGTIGGGGGGGSGSDDGIAESAGGGGAGNIGGIKGGGNVYNGGGSLVSITPAEDGTVNSGGSGARVVYNEGDADEFLIGGKGGNLGADGAGGSGTNGLGGDSVKKNGNTLTLTGNALETPAI